MDDVIGMEVRHAARNVQCEPRLEAAREVPIGRGDDYGMDGLQGKSFAAIYPMRKRIKQPGAILVQVWKLPLPASTTFQKSGDVIALGIKLYALRSNDECITN
jgi:hypothetical protein